MALIALAGFCDQSTHSESNSEKIECIEHLVGETEARLTRNF